MTGSQFRAARALLGLSTRQVADSVGCSAMAISKAERDKFSAQAKLWLVLLRFYWSRDIAFYADGVIVTSSRTVQTYADPLRNRLEASEAGSAYVAAFDRIVDLASRVREECRA